MSTAIDLLPLARAAVESADARAVLADAIEETGWWDDRIRYALSKDGDRDRDREEFLSLLTWPGGMGERHAQVVVEALTTPAPGEGQKP